MSQSSTTRWGASPPTTGARLRPLPLPPLPPASLPFLLRTASPAVFWPLRTLQLQRRRLFVRSLMWTMRLISPQGQLIMGLAAVAVAVRYGLNGFTISPRLPLCPESTPPPLAIPPPATPRGPLSTSLTVSLPPAAASAAFASGTEAAAAAAAAI